MSSLTCDVLALTLLHFHFWFKYVSAVRLQVKSRVRRAAARKMPISIEKMHANCYKWMETTYQRDYKKPQLVLTPRAKAPLCHPFWISVKSCCQKPLETTYQHDYNIPKVSNHRILIWAQFIYVLENLFLSGTESLRRKPSLTRRNQLQRSPLLDLVNQYQELKWSHFQAKQHLTVTRPSRSRKEPPTSRLTSRRLSFIHGPKIVKMLLHPHRAVYAKFVPFDSIVSWDLLVLFEINTSQLIIYK